MNTERENILGRIGEALRLTAPQPGHRDPAEPLRTAATAAREWLPVVEEQTEARWALFARKSVELKTTLIFCDTLSDATAKLREIARAENWQRVACHGKASAANLASSLGLPTVNTTPSYNVAELESCDAGITECDALVAQTGSVLLTSRSGGGRALSVLPPRHIVIAQRDQLVPDLPAAYAQLHATYGGRWPSLIAFITGPSRTGDIERILVLGAHGPKKLTILVVP